MTLAQRLQALLHDLSHFPWRTTAQTLRLRFHEDHLALTASSLTFTTTLALVPFFVVALAVLTAFPMFSQMQDVLQRWLVASLVPESISRQVLGYLTQFARQANRLGGLGLGVVFLTALALILTIDRTLNNIWRVRRPRPLAQRVLIYWAAITLGPLVLGASLMLTSFFVSPTRALSGNIPGGIKLVLDSFEFALLAFGMAALYRYVPNAPVKWGHAWSGGLFVAVGIESGKRLLAAYIGNIPTYSVVYGAFATVPILLLWIYVAWVIVLLGAVIAAYLPALLSGVARRGGEHGWSFQLALEVVALLRDERDTAQRGLSGPQLAQRMRVDVLQLEPALETLLALDWIGRLASDPERAELDEERYVLLVDPDRLVLAPLMQRLLLDAAPAGSPLWHHERWAGLTLGEALAPPAAMPALAASEHGARSDSLPAAVPRLPSA
ncbi:MAG: YihY family inner membrane protein [Burkholderiales bacterium]|nr:YihY family inner membrane protein [Burkholderiales bacterium]